MSTYDDLVAADGATAHWPLHSITSGTVADIIDRHSAVVYNVTPPQVPGPISGETALDFSAQGGSFPFASIGGPPTVPRPPGPFTWEGWVKMNPAATDNSTLFSSAANGTGGQFTGWFIALQTGTPPSLFLGRYGNSGASDDAGAGTPTLMNGAWHHVVVTGDGAGGAALYLDGSPLTLSFADPLVTTISADTALIGGDAEGFDPSSDYQGRFWGALAHVAVYPLALTACQVLSHYDLATTGSFVPCRDWLVLYHADGHPCWATNAQTMRLYSGNTNVLETPFPHIAQTTLYLGHDPATGRPAWAPQMAPQIIIQQAPNNPTMPTPPPVAPPDQCVQIRCGVAQALEDELEHLWGQWSGWIGAGLKAAGLILGAALVDFLGGLAILAGPEAVALIILLGPLLVIGTEEELEACVTPPGPTTWAASLKAIFCILGCDGGTVQVTPDNITAWHDWVTANPSLWANEIQQGIVAAILHFTTFQSWLTAAQGASVSNVCDLWTCP